MSDDPGVVADQGGGPDRPETLEDFEQHWDSMLPRLARRVGMVLVEFGDVDDLVDEILDRARARCGRRAQSDRVNRKFILKTTTRVALSKRDRLRRRREAAARNLRQASPHQGEAESMSRVDILRRVDQALMAADGGGKEIIFEVLRQYRDHKTLSYKEMGRVLDCSEWTARAKTARCFAEIRTRLRTRGKDGPRAWFW